MARKNYTVDEVLRDLSKKKDVRVNGGTIEVLMPGSNKRQHDIGNGTNGKIDFLVNHNNYKRYYVSKFSTEYHNH